jgi:hypothetical protein
LEHFDLNQLRLVREYIMPIVPFLPQDNMGDDEKAPGYSDTIEEEQSPAGASPEAKLPSEAQGEVNGGPLGCCLGVTVGLLLSLTVAILSRFYADPLAQVLHGGLSVIVRIVMFILAIAGAVLFGYFGWKIGKRLYREYEPPVIKDRTRRRKSKPKEA